MSCCLKPVQIKNVLCQCVKHHLKCRGHEFLNCPYPQCEPIKITFTLIHSTFFFPLFLACCFVSAEIAPPPVPSSLSGIVCLRCTTTPSDQWLKVDRVDNQRCATDKPRATHFRFVWFYQLKTYSATLSLFNRLRATGLLWY